MKPQTALDKATAEWHHDAEPPTHLRARVLEGATEAVSVSVPAASVANRHRILWATGGALALSGASAALFLTFSTPPRPAYADVALASTQVKTVQYREMHTIYHTKSGKVARQTTFAKARFDIPAIRRDSQDWMSIQTHEWYLWRNRDQYGKWRSTRKPARRNEQIPLSAGFTPATEVRQMITENIIPPKPDELNEVVTSEVIENGWRLTRFDFQKRGKNFGPGRLTRTGWRETVWADNKTRRVVRTQHEYYNGASHSLDVNDQFRYDEPLPSSLFDTSRPQETLAR